MRRKPDGMQSSAQLEINPPRRFTLGAVLIVTAFGVFRALPIIAAILLISVLRFGPWTIIIPLAALAASAIFVPFGLGNPYIAKLVHDNTPDAAADPDNFIVQLTLSPRIRSGVRAVFEDADDIGVLAFAGGNLLFQGDSVNLKVPLAQISVVRRQNSGPRGFYVYGRRLHLAVAGLPNVESIEIAERSSWLLTTSRKTTKKLLEKFA
jgi:hypothetical protein